jgi:hypothetical protein
LGEETGCEGRHAGPWFGSVRGDRGAGTEDGARDVGAEDCRVVGDGGHAVVSLVVVYWVEGDGFDFDEEVVGTWGGGWSVFDDEGGALGGEMAARCWLDMVDGRF